MTKTNRQYERMAEAAAEKLRLRSPEELAAKTGFFWDDKQLTAASLGIPVAVSPADWSVSPGLDSWHALTILQYLASTTGAMPTGCFLSISDFRSGGLARGTSFDRLNDSAIQRLGTYPVSVLRSAADMLGGTELKEKSDLTFLFSFLPYLPIKLNLWLADDDFPASGKVLFDASAETELQVEAAGTAAGILLTLLEAAAVRLQGA